MENPERSLQYLEELEKQGEDILKDRLEIIQLDKQRNQNREALSALSRGGCDKTWLTLGPIMIKLPVKKAQQLLSDDQVKVNTEINKIRSNLKVKVNNLRDMEHQTPVPGLMLNPLNHAEMQAMGQTWGRHAS